MSFVSFISFYFYVIFGVWSDYCDLTWFADVKNFVQLDLIECYNVTALFHFQNPDILQKKRHSNQDNIDEDDLIEIATEAFVRELGLEDSTYLQGKVEIREVSAGTYLMKEDSNKVINTIKILKNEWFQNVSNILVFYYKWKQHERWVSYVVKYLSKITDTD